MNNFLIDTHVFLWLNFSPEKCSPKMLAQLEARDNSVAVSVISFWEIALKYQLGKLTLTGVLPHELLHSAEQMGITIATLTPQEYATFFQLPVIDGHRDPFDRLLIWQCICQNKILMSHDSQLDRYSHLGGCNSHIDKFSSYF